MRELFEILSMLFMLYAKYKKIKRKRRWSVRPTNVDREINGYFKSTYNRMKDIDPELFFEQTRMRRPLYNLLLTLIKDDLQNNRRKLGIDLECRLAITLSYLSQGVTPTFLAWAYKLGRATVRSIILETCDTIWRVLSPIYVSKPTEADYILIAEQFNQKWNMPHCIGSIDGKHIQIRKPRNTGSMYFNYKKTHSIVLLAACDANYIFTDVCVGAYGCQSDGGILRASKFGSDVLGDKLPVPQPSPLGETHSSFPYFLVGDAAFPLRTNIMRPYPGKQLSDDKEIFNYRLSRARRMIENSFGILTARWRVLNNSMHLLPRNAERVVLATIALHNFIMLNDPGNHYLPEKFTDWEDSSHQLHPGEWRQEQQGLHSVRLGANNASRKAFDLRDCLKKYLNEEGAVPFQYIRKNMHC